MVLLYMVLWGCAMTVNPALRACLNLLAAYVEPVSRARVGRAAAGACACCINCQRPRPDGAHVSSWLPACCRGVQEEPCPICYEDMVGQDLDNLVWCRYGCGRNVHGKCMG